MISKDQAKKTKWYRQSGAGVPLCVGMPFLSFRRIYDRSGFHFPNAIVILFKNGGNYNFSNYFDYALTLDQARKIISKWEKSPSLFQEMEKDFGQAGQKMEEIGLKSLEVPVGSKEFASLFEEFVELTLTWWGNSLYVDLFDPAEEIILDYIFGNRRAEIGKGNINILMSPDKLSKFQEEQKELLSIFGLAKENGITEEVSSLLEEHSRKYYWLKNDYEVFEYLGPEYYLKQLEKLVSDPELVNQIVPGLDKFEANQQKKRDIVNELKLDSDIVRKLGFFNWTTTFRDERKRYNQICNYVLLKNAERISGDLSFPVDLVKEALPTEIIRLVKGDQALIEDLRLRAQSGLITFTDLEQGLDMRSGDVVREYYDILEQTIQASEIKGATASAGKAIGTAKIIMNQNDFPKMERGDVLVAPMTRPEYVPVMKMASAIVTDEGGITCHAAIISRELGIPCITGTQVATKSLHDGDMIDVNADHGLIKMIKQAEE